MKINPNIVFNDILKNFLLNFLKAPSIFPKGKAELSEVFINKITNEIIKKQFKEENKEKFISIIKNFNPESLDIKKILKDESFLKIIKKDENLKEIIDKVFDKEKNSLKNDSFFNQKEEVFKCIKIAILFLKQKDFADKKNIKDECQSKDFIKNSQIFPKIVLSNIRTTLNESTNLKLFQSNEILQTLKDNNIKLHIPHGIVSHHEKEKSKKTFRKKINQKNKNKSQNFDDQSLEDYKENNDLK